MFSRPITASLIACLLGILGCGDETTPDTTAGSCTTQVAEGQVCNSLVDVSTSVKPTCVTGEMPVGAGGTIVDGTYVLTEQIYYNEPGCPVLPIGGTIVISGNCVQAANVQFSVTASSSISVQGNSITTTQTCVSGDIDPASFTPDAPTRTYTATPTTFTLFILNSAANSPNPDRVEVFTRR
jgi:hypothetical protein